MLRVAFHWPLLLSTDLLCRRGRAAAVNMKNLAWLLAILTILALPCECRGVPPEDTLVWPQPQRQTAGAIVGSVASSTAFSWVYANETDGGAATAVIHAAFARYKAIVFSTGAKARSGSGRGGPTLTGIEVTLLETAAELSSDVDESYTLTVEFPRATLRAPSCYGALRGLETFSQLVQLDLSVRQQTVEDWPRFPFRAVLIDTGRHFLPVSLIEAHLDAMGERG